MVSNMKQNKNKELFDSCINSGLYMITCIPEQKHYIRQSENDLRRLNAHKPHFTLKKKCS